LADESRKSFTFNILAAGSLFGAAFAGPVGCKVIAQHGISNIFTIDGVSCLSVWNVGTPACHNSFDDRITLQGDGNCEGTIYWVIPTGRIPTISS
jgi:hypothetical protein